MCLTAEALALFLNMIAAPTSSAEPGFIVVHAHASDIHWVAVEDVWCTEAPTLDRVATLKVE